MPFLRSILSCKKWSLAYAVVAGIAAATFVAGFWPAVPRATIREPLKRRRYDAPDGKSFVAVRELGKPDRNGRVPLDDSVTEIVLAHSRLNEEIKSWRLPQVDVFHVIYALDSRKIVLLIRNKSQPGNWQSSVQLLDSQNGDDHTVVTSDEWEALGRILFGALFFTSNGDLLGLCRNYQGEDKKLVYEIWDVFRQKQISTGLIPEWWSDPNKCGASMMQLAKATEGHLDKVFWVCNRHLFPSEIDTVLRTVSADGRRLYRNDMWEPTLTIHDMVNGTCRTLTLPRSLSYPLRLSPDERSLVVGQTGWSTKETAWQRLRDWLNLPAEARPPDSVSLVDISRGLVLAEFRNANGAQFSATGDSLSVYYTDRIEIWNLPLRRPWIRIVAASVAVFSAVIALSMAMPYVRRFCNLAAAKSSIPAG